MGSWLSVFILCCSCFCFISNAANQDGNQDLKKACQEFVRDYRELYNKAEEREYKPYFANLYVATTILENISVQDFDKFRSDHVSDNGAIIVIVLKLVNVAILLSSNPENVISWSMYFGSILELYPDLSDDAKDPQSYPFNTSKKKGDLPFEWDS